MIAFISANPTVSNSAESAIVSFNDAEQLVALTDSVVGVCDTVYSEGQTELGYIFVSDITCRRLVCVTVVEHYYHGITRWFTMNGDTIWVDATGGGKAIIFYEEVK